MNWLRKIAILLGFLFLSHSSDALSSTCIVENDTDQKIVVLTFNNLDNVYLFYYQKYTLLPGQSTEVQAVWDFFGLKVAVVYDVQGNQMLWRLWFGHFGRHNRDLCCCCCYGTGCQLLKENSNSKPFEWSKRRIVPCNHGIGRCFTQLLIKTVIVVLDMPPPVVEVSCKNK